MKKEITFGAYSAILNASAERAMLTIKHKRLPLKIADKINEAGDIIATEVFFDDDKTVVSVLLMTSQWANSQT